MIWLYIIGSIIGGLFVLRILFRILNRLSKKKELSKDPVGYCETLFQEFEQGAPKRKIKALQELLKLAASRMQPALKQVWKLYNNGITSPETHKVLKNFLFEYDNDAWRKREAAIKKRMANWPKEELDYALKLLAENDPFKNAENKWSSVEHTIKEISRRRPFPHERQLRLDYLCVITYFNVFNSGAYYPGGTYEEIARKRDEAVREVELERDRINSTYEKALIMLSSNEGQAVEFFRKEMSKHKHLGCG